MTSQGDLLASTLTQQLWYLEVCDQVLKVMQLQQIVFTLCQNSQGCPHEDVGAVLCQHHINHPAGKCCREGTAVDGEEPL